MPLEQSRLQAGSRPQKTRTRDTQRLSFCPPTPQGTPTRTDMNANKSLLKPTGTELQYTYLLFQCICVLVTSDIVLKLSDTARQRSISILIVLFPMPCCVFRSPVRVVGNATTVVLQTRTSVNKLLLLQ